MKTRTDQILNCINPFFKKNIIQPLIILAICLWAYSNVFHNGFLLDDYSFLIGDDTLKNVSLSDIYTKTYGINKYRPIGLSFLKAELSIFGENPVGYHLVNLALFYTVCLLFYALLFKLLNNPKLSFLTVCLFAAHPINNFLVNYKTAGYLSLNIIFMQISILLFLKYLNNKKALWYIGSLILYFLNLFLYELSFMLPIYLFTILFFFSNINLKRKFLLYSGYFIALSAYFLIRILFIESNPLPNHAILDNLKISFSSYLMIPWKLILLYISKLIFLKDILFLYDIPTNTRIYWIDWTTFFWAIMTVAYLVLNQWKKDVKSFSLVLFCAGLAPIWLITFTYSYVTRTALMEPHWFYFSSIGFFILLAQFLIFLSKHFNLKYWLTLHILVVLFLITFTHTTNKIWKDEETFCKYALKINALNIPLVKGFLRGYKQNHGKSLSDEELVEIFKNVYSINTGYIQSILEINSPNSSNTH